MPTGAARHDYQKTPSGRGAERETSRAPAVSRSYGPHLMVKFVELLVHLAICEWLMERPPRTSSLIQRPCRSGTPSPYPAMAMLSSVACERVPAPPGLLPGAMMLIPS